MNKTSIKTDAPPKLLWDIMRTWEKENPVNKQRLKENTPAANILSKDIEHQCSFQIHPEANPESKKMGLLRFQPNPLPNWGPGMRSTAM